MIDILTPLQRLGGMNLENEIAEAEKAWKGRSLLKRLDHCQNCGLFTPDEVEMLKNATVVYALAEEQPDQVGLDGQPLALLAWNAAEMYGIDLPGDEA